MILLVNGLNNSVPIIEPEYSLYCSLLKPRMPKVDAAEALTEDNESQSIEQQGEPDENKKKKHKREKVGFRDRKVL